MSYSTFLPSWPFWSQLSDWTSDGPSGINSAPDENKTLNCGEECLAMVLKWLTGIELPADFIHDVILREGVIASTTADQLTRFLSRYCATWSTKLTVADRASVIGTIQNYLQTGRPVITLCHWETPDSPHGHWRVVMGDDGSNFYSADPWTGTRIVESYDRFMSMYWGTLIGIERTRDSNLS